MKLEEAVKESRSGDVADTGTSPDTLSTPSKVKEHPVEWATAQAVSADSKCDYIVYTMRDQKNEVVAVLIEKKTTHHPWFKHAIAEVTSLNSS